MWLTHTRTIYKFFCIPAFPDPQVLYLIFSQFFGYASVFFGCASAFFGFAFAFFESASAAITAPGESSASSACLRVGASSRVPPRHRHRLLRVPPRAITASSASVLA
ncbi:hypothetical protein ACSQ67_023757 [Phaseolus vulgaris]